MSTIKVNTLTTLNGSGNITVSRPLSGSGASLTALNATNLASGTVATARLGSGTANNTVFLRGDGTWATAGSTSASDLTSGTLPMARLSGTLPALNGSALTALNATQLTSGTLPMARLSGTLPALNGSALTNLPASGARANIIINGGMAVAQRGTSFASPANNEYTLDRWRANVGGAVAITITQDTDVPADQGLDMSLKIDVTTADTSIAAGDFCGVAYRVEGRDIAHLRSGTSSAQAATLSFWVKSTVTGTYYVAFRNSAADRNYCASYTISSANTWEQKTISITCDTSGTWVTGTGIGMEIRFSFATGSTYHGTANTWQAGNLFAGSNITNGINSTSNNIYLTGVKLEKGSTATDFEQRTYADELAMCERYYEKIIGEMYNGVATISGGYYIYVHWRTFKRSNGTTTSAGYQHTVTYGDDEYGFIHKPSGTAGNYIRLDWIAIDAEL